MINLNDMIEAEIENGYGDANAQAKVCQDVILKAISASSLSRNVTIKGGVVMRSKTKNIRRAKIIIKEFKKKKTLPPS